MMLKVNRTFESSWRTVALVGLTSCWLHTEHTDGEQRSGLYSVTPAIRISCNWFELKLASIFMKVQTTNFYSHLSSLERWDSSFIPILSSGFPRTGMNGVLHFFKFSHSREHFQMRNMFLVFQHAILLWMTDQNSEYKQCICIIVDMA